MMRYVWLTWQYLTRMLPGALAALALYACLHPGRRRRLRAAGLVIALTLGGPYGTIRVFRL